MKTVKNYVFKNKKEICNLECKKPKKTKKTFNWFKGVQEEKEVYPQVHEFRGPVRLVVVDPPDEPDTKCKNTAAGFISMANIAIGVNFIIYTLYSMGFIFSRTMNFHMFFCALGFQFLLPLSILIHHPLYGAAGPLSDGARTWAHCKFLILAFIFIAFGYVKAIEMRDNETKSWLRKIAEEKIFTYRYHYFFGNATELPLLIALVTGIAIVILRRSTWSSCMTKFVAILSIIHTISGLLTLLLGNVCFILSLFTLRFQIFVFFSSGLAPTLVMIFFVVFYTVIMLIIPGRSYKD